MRQVPQSEDAEKALLSAWMDDPVGVPGICATCGVSAGWFINPFCAALYTVLHEMWMSGSVFARPIVAEAMRKTGEWGPTGAAQLYDIETFSPIPSAAPALIETLKDKAILRGLIQTCQEIEAKAWSETSSSELLPAAVKGISDVSNLGAKTKTKSLIEHASEYYTSLADAEGADTQIRTGITKLDRMSPVFPGDMPCISGEKKSGKSILSISIALRVSEKAPVLYFSLEDRAKKLIKRIVSNVAKVPTFAHRNPSAGQEMQMAAALDRMKKMNFTLHDDVYDLAGIVGSTRQFKAQNPNLAAVFVDYLQLVRGGRQKNETREMEVANVSRTLRLLAMETDAAIFVLSQLNQDGASRESRAIEMDITAMWKLGLVEDQHGVRLLEIPFQRDNESGIAFEVAFLGECATVESLDSDHEG